MTIEMAVVYDHFQANLVSFKRIKKNHSYNTNILCCRRKRQEPFHSLSSPLTRSPESTFQALGGGLRLNKVGYFIIRHHHCNNLLNNARHAILLYTCFPYCKQICCIYIYSCIGKGVYYLRQPSIVLFLGAYDINIAYIF